LKLNIDDEQRASLIREAASLIRRTRKLNRISGRPPHVVVSAALYEAVARRRLNVIQRKIYKISNIATVILRNAVKIFQYTFDKPKVQLTITMFMDGLSLEARSEAPVKALGFGRSSITLATMVGELRRFKKGVKALKQYAGFINTRSKYRPKEHRCSEACQHGEYNRLLHGVVFSLATMAVMNKVEPWLSTYNKLRNKRGLKRKQALNRAATKILVAVFKALRAG